MAAQKNKGGKAGKKPQGRKARLWVRDGLNILAGLLIGGLGVFLVSEYLQGREARQASAQAMRVFEESAPLLKSVAERYLAVEENRQEASRPLEGLELGRPLCSPEAMKSLQGEFRVLPPDALTLLWDYYLNLHDAELFRKLLREQQDDPDRVAEMMTRGFLQAAHENHLLLPKVRWELKGTSASGE